MPNVRKFTPDEVRAMVDKGKGARKLLIERMDQAFAGFEAGDYGELRAEAGESDLTARLRLKAAARRRGLKITFLRRRGVVKLFRVEAGDPAPSGARRKPAAKDTPAAKAARGRPKKA